MRPKPMLYDTLKGLATDPTLLSSLALEGSPFSTYSMPQACQGEYAFALAWMGTCSVLFIPVAEAAHSG